MLYMLQEICLVFSARFDFNKERTFSLHISQKNSVNKAKIVKEVTKNQQGNGNIQITNFGNG